LPLYPNEMVPLQIDRAIELGRYLPVHLPNHRTSPAGRSDEYRTSAARFRHTGRSCLRIVKDMAVGVALVR
jgi:hypothetical protein